MEVVLNILSLSDDSGYPEASDGRWPAGPQNSVLFPEREGETGIAFLKRAQGLLKTSPALEDPPVEVQGYLCQGRIVNEVIFVR